MQKKIDFFKILKCTSTNSQPKNSTRDKDKHRKWQMFPHSTVILRK